MKYTVCMLLRPVIYYSIVLLCHWGVLCHCSTGVCWSHSVWHFEASAWMLHTNPTVLTGRLQSSQFVSFIRCYWV